MFLWLFQRLFIILILPRSCHTVVYSLRYGLDTSFPTVFHRATSQGLIQIGVLANTKVESVFQNRLHTPWSHHLSQFQLCYAPKYNESTANRTLNNNIQPTVYSQNQSIIPALTYMYMYACVYLYKKLFSTLALAPRTKARRQFT